MSDNTHASTAVFRRTTSRERANLGFSRTSFCGRQAALTARPWIATVFDHKPSGGARRDRTDDLLLAKQALSQLSYGPCTDWLASRSSRQLAQPAFAKASAGSLLSLRERRLVGLGRFELPTSRLSSARSNQLSYKPGSEDR